MEEFYNPIKSWATTGIKNRENIAILRSFLELSLNYTRYRDSRSILNHRLNALYKAVGELQGQILGAMKKFMEGKVSINYEKIKSHNENLFSKLTISENELYSNEKDLFSNEKKYRDLFGLENSYLSLMAPYIDRLNNTFMAVGGGKNQIGSGQAVSILANSNIIPELKAVDTLSMGGLVSHKLQACTHAITEYQKNTKSNAVSIIQQLIGDRNSDLKIEQLIGVVVEGQMAITVEILKKGIQECSKKPTDANSLKAEKEPFIDTATGKNANVMREKKVAAIGQIQGLQDVITSYASRMSVATPAPILSAKNTQAYRWVDASGKTHQNPLPNFNPEWESSCANQMEIIVSNINRLLHEIQYSSYKGFSYWIANTSYKSGAVFNSQQPNYTTLNQYNGRSYLSSVEGNGNINLPKHRGDHQYPSKGYTLKNMFGGSASNMSELDLYFDVQVRYYGMSQPDADQAKLQAQSKSGSGASKPVAHAAAAVSSKPVEESQEPDGSPQVMSSSASVGSSPVESLSPLEEQIMILKNVAQKKYNKPWGKDVIEQIWLKYDKLTDITDKLFPASGKDAIKAAILKAIAIPVRESIRPSSRPASQGLVESQQSVRGAEPPTPPPLPSSRGRVAPVVGSPQASSRGRYAPVVRSPQASSRGRVAPVVGSPQAASRGRASPGLLDQIQSRSQAPLKPVSKPPSNQGSRPNQNNLFYVNNAIADRGRALNPDTDKSNDSSNDWDSSTEGGYYGQYGGSNYNYDLGDYNPVSMGMNPDNASLNRLYATNADIDNTGYYDFDQNHIYSGIGNNQTSYGYGLPIFKSVNDIILFRPLISSRTYDLLFQTDLRGLLNSSRFNSTDYVLGHNSANVFNYDMNKDWHQYLPLHFDKAIGVPAIIPYTDQAPFKHGITGKRRFLSPGSGNTTDDVEEAGRFRNMKEFIAHVVDKIEVTRKIVKTLEKYHKEIFENKKHVFRNIMKHDQTPVDSRITNMQHMGTAINVASADRSQITKSEKMLHFLLEQIHYAIQIVIKENNEKPIKKVIDLLGKNTQTIINTLENYKTTEYDKVAETTINSTTTDDSVVGRLWSAADEQSGGRRRAMKSKTTRKK